MPYWIINRNKSVIKTSPLFIYTNITKNINSLLLTSTITLNISDQAIIYNFINKNDFININKEKRYLLEMEFSIKDEAVIQSMY